MATDIQQLTQDLRDFAQVRQWEMFHSPKNLASALSVEAAELLEHFQWMSEAKSRNLTAAKRTEIGTEIADVFLYLLQLADKLDIDVIEAAKSKMLVNASKYPVPPPA
ncbi:NTP pyrophosphatase, house-cleaning of non-canonical NTPs [Variovorax sp. YR266]|uniref:nucleotide pyrophosphohydrolase n=1 Tax=Variovorax sp. YR266 TaxID=1884386 RepID=UPI0008965CF4|nr:nucleotide pyrophosphohydrolase [Variovorax sp. YR266]SDZ67725.1 NTP pyrophosphatase, house-cleaning of non-canonical NTPs [Variovorax sp. YR266]